MSQNRRHVHEAVKLNPSLLIELLEVDLTVHGGPVLHVFNGDKFNNTVIYWNNKEFTAFPCALTGISARSTGSANRPVLKLSAVNEVVRPLLRQYEDLVGARITRNLVFAKYLPKENFPNNENPLESNRSIYPDSYRVFRKVREDKVSVEFELVSYVDFKGKFPTRIVSSTHCVATYRDPDTCGYTGPPVTTQNGTFFPSDISRPESFKGEWNAEAGYSYGDWVIMTVPLVFSPSNLQKFAFVCSHSNTGKDPRYHTDLWRMDMCPKILDHPGCKSRFKEGPWPANVMPGLSKIPTV